ncbi:hypothetical protein HY229_00660 [Candidatus Acetothermia bacterium]|nr:hypothetical protein [Candidatus Acetothermia bacterium]MBI3642601.1 hypothetical protein [Candidatus Acetothermia bacterium]
MHKMISSRKILVLFVGIIALSLLGYGGFSLMGQNQTAPENTSRLSINPYSVHLDGGASILMSGFEAPVRLPANAGVPNISFGFTVPNDYVPNTPMTLELLWETPNTHCDFVFGSNFMYRAGEGQAQDLGSASGGFRPLDASTEFKVTDFTITVAAPADAHKTAMLRFQITPTAGEFDSLLSGDAVNVSLGRLDKQETDTCGGDVGMAGISVVYSTK